MQWISSVEERKKKKWIGKCLDKRDFWLKMNLKMRLNWMVKIEECYSFWYCRHFEDDDDDDDENERKGMNNDTLTI